MIIVPHLEWHVSHSCNLTCESCIHFTNHGFTEKISIETLKEWYSLWNERISPQRMVILGGEPLLNENIIEIIYLTKEMWKQPENGNFWITTNGMLIDKHPDLPKALKENGCMLQISIHGNRNTPEYWKKMEKTFDKIKEWDSLHNIKLIDCDNDEDFSKLKPTKHESYIVFRDMVSDWSRSYNGFGINSEPFDDGDPEKSWRNCVAGQECFQLYDGKIYKCCMTAYLNLQKKKYGDLLSKKWNPYLKYTPLNHNCSDSEIVDFFNRKVESVCGMCPKNPRIFQKKDPTLPLSFHSKNNNFKFTFN